MDARSFVGLAALSCATLAFVTGCLTPTPPENAVTWGVKAASGRLTDTTAREWQAVAEKINERTPEANISLTDQQAAAIVDFLQANELDRIQDIVDVIERAQQDPSSVGDLVIPDSLTNLFGQGSAGFEGVIEELVPGT